MDLDAINTDLLTPAALSKFFGEAYFSRGEAYYREGHVLRVSRDKKGQKITAVVQGSQHQRYHIHITVTTVHQKMTIEGYCSCPIGYNCKHVVAALLDVASQLKKTSSVSVLPFPTPVVEAMPPTASHTALVVDSWLHRFQHALQQTRPSSSISPPLIADCHYVLSLSTASPFTALIEVILSWPSTVTSTKIRPIKLPIITDKTYWGAEDVRIIESLQLMDKGLSPKKQPLQFHLEGINSSALLQQILQTARCHFQSTTDAPLTLSEPQPAQFRWALQNNGHQILQLVLKTLINPPVFILANTVWYIDTDQFICAPLALGISLDITRMLLEAPELTPESAFVFHEYIKPLLPDHPTLLPYTYQNIEQHDDVPPQPQLRLSAMHAMRDDESDDDIDDYYDLDEDDDDYLEETLMIAEVAFKYNHHHVMMGDTTSRFFELDEANRLHITTRQGNKELAHLEFLNQQMHLTAFVAEDYYWDEETKGPSEYAAVVESLQDDQDLLQFVINTVPVLQQHGWEVILDDSITLNVVPDADIEWYSELEESQYNYFDYELGVLIEGEKINLLPFVVTLLRTMSSDELTNLNDNYRFPLELSDNRTIVIPMDRLRPIINVLIELYDKDILNSHNKLTLSKHRAALLHDIEKAFLCTQMRWLGGERLRQLGAKLAQFKQIETVKIPAFFKADLRPYQQEGVNWLQFLREYELAGILADDMGLGKTIQTLAHLCIEKSKKRMNKPSLIIAPTSLMVNWQLESQKFAPKLRTLVCHGAERAQHYANIQQYDVVFTTYPLLVRDKEILLDNEFYYLILDEAHCIKNAKAKSTQIVLQLKAEHRLCLTGTPVENHLGELWSLFHFLIPGFLGDSQQFKQLFRTPIEKHNDKNRHAALAKRVAPFMMRRLKSEVVKELPPKTEILRVVELQGAQRDLYETIRLAMQKKVQQAIQAKGLSRSHIILLDALLKLRQICCDPRLLSLPSAKKAYNTSAKLDLLKELLPNLVAEGRKILVFSQFTSMLALIEQLLTKLELPYVKLTGRTTNRKAPIDAFQNGEVPIFLISLKAGGTGLNLTAADTVIHYDPWWNPAVEDQATDRSHRIGQEKSVFVYKLIAAGTVEETIQTMQQNKRRLMEGLFAQRQEGKFSLSASNIKQLFQPLG